MESSMNSMNVKALLSKAQTQDSPEESSWTFYIQDFLRDNNEYSSFSSGYESPSLVSDAASSAAKKAKIDHEAAGFSCDRSKRKSSTFKKRKAKIAAIDDDLEDTASSPANSPKVSYMNQFEMKQKEKASFDISEGKRNASSHNGFAVLGRDSDITELKKKGLCLVPLSNIANYFSQ